jgi:hypothetical protein
MIGTYLWLLLEASGRHARLVLPVGVLLAVLLPESHGMFKPLAPLILALLVASAVVRLDSVAVLKAALQPHRLFHNFLISLGLLVLAPTVLVLTARGLGLDQMLLPFITWYAVAPPIATTIWMCVFLGFTAPVAMEIVVLTNILAPFTGPYLGGVLLGEVVPISSSELCMRIGVILGGGMLAALVLRKLWGAARVEANRQRLDGVSTLAMLAFLVPVFDGIAGLAAGMPLLALICVGLACALNFGSQALIFVFGSLLLSQRGKLPEGTRSIAVVAGNRNLGLYFAALPADPFFSLFVAAYQLPIYLTPMIAGWFAGRRADV